MLGRSLAMASGTFPLTGVPCPKATPWERNALVSTVVILLSVTDKGAVCNVEAAD